MTRKSRKPVKSKAKPRKRAAAPAAPVTPAAAEAPSNPRRLVAEQKEAARRLGITDRSLRTWMREAGFPDWSAGYDLDAIEAFRHERGLKGSEESEQESEIRRRRELERLKQDEIKTQRERYKLAVQEKELLPRRGWELFAATLLTSLGDWCEQLPDLIAGVCSDDCREAVRERIADELDGRREDLREEFDRKAAEAREATEGLP